MPPPTNYVQEALEARRKEAEEANAQGDVSLAEAKRIRIESHVIHTQVKKTLRENHFADLMLRALEPR